MKWFLFLILIFFSCKFKGPASILYITNGEVDLSNYNFDTQAPVKLYGKFKFYHEKLAHEIEPQTNTNLLDVPKSWTEAHYPPFGYGTYEVKILLPVHSKTLALYIPDAATSFRVLWNGRVLGGAGKVGKNSVDYKPSYKTRVLPLENLQAENQLLIEVANFKHHKAGLWEAIYIGNIEHLENRNLLKNYLYTFLIGACCILGFYHLGIFRFKKKDFLELFFALVCFSFSLQNFFFNSNLVYALFPKIEWEVLVRLVYFFSYLPGVFFVLFYERLFPKTFSFLFFRTYIVLLVLLCISTVVLPIYYFTQTLGFSFILNVSCFIYVLIRLLSLKHPKNFQYYLVLFSISMLIFTLTLDALSLQQVLPFSSISIFGIFLFIYCHAYILSIRFSKALLSVGNLAQRLRRSNERLRFLKAELEAIIEKRTQELIRERTRAELIGRMTTEIVHDLKNPISAIIGFSGLANTDDIGRKARQEYLELIQAESIKLADLSQGILDFVKGETKLQKERVNLKTYFESINKLIATELKLAGIEYKFSLETTKEGYFDPDLLRRVLLNIISNAIHALLKTSKGRKIFSICITSSENDLYIELSDNAAGIPKEIQSRIFEPFITYGKKGGTGLGMALSKEIIELHEGEISFVTKENIGTTFFIKLPLR